MYTCPNCDNSMALTRGPLQAEIDRLLKANQLLHDATIALMNGMGGHNHWDPTQRRGVGCEVCKQQRAARADATRLIEAAEAAGKEE